MSQQVNVRAAPGDRSSNSRVGAVLPSRLSCLVQVKHFLPPTTGT